MLFEVLNINYKKKLQFIFECVRRKNILKDTEINILISILSHYCT
jgi:hypothetical protein